MARGFFGYGSLVNTTTHNHRVATKAHLSGWRRCWQQSSRREVAYLTVRPSQDTSIDGLVALVAPEDWAALDQREFSYQRKRLTIGALATQMPLDADVIIYQGRPEYCIPGPAERPILQSYLDCVVQGYLQQFGMEGVRGFFASTDGWDTPVFDDRSCPRYPRAQLVAQRTKEIVDDLVEEFSGARGTSASPL